MYCYFDMGYDAATYQICIYVPNLRPVPTGPFSRQPTPIVGRFPSADSRGFKILNMFDRASRPTITESVVESADSAVESADGKLA